MSGRTIVEKLISAQKDLRELREERAMVCNRARYEELTYPGGVISQAEQVVKNLQDELQAHMKKTYGVNYYTLRDIL